MFVWPVPRGTCHLSPSLRATHRSRDALGVRMGAEAVWAISAGNREPRGLFDISGEGFTDEIDTGRTQWSGMWSRGYGRVDLSRSCSLKSRRAGVSISVNRAGVPFSFLFLRRVRRVGKLGPRFLDVDITVGEFSVISIHWFVATSKTQNTLNTS